jgi:methylenetetrahydrofolate dehydrogenase (NADP+)/methenyltetrahydrofolate cyclohydrolase
MTAKTIDGKKTAAWVLESIKPRVAALKKRGVTPGLAAVIVGDDPASKLYVKLKTKAAKEAGLSAFDHKLPEKTSESELLSLITQLNRDSSVHGILVQLPLPKHIDKRRVMSAVSPEKDVDGFNPLNLGKIFVGDESLAPATPKGVVKLIECATKIKGKEAVIVSHSTLIGKPLSLMLLARNATVTVCHEFTRDLALHTKNADILVSAAGVPKLIKAGMVKKGAVVVDVGVAKTKDGICGDVDFEAVKKKASRITPVPGGVGPVTVAMVIENTVTAAEKIHF